MARDDGPILIVGGPTASGKSALALDLARHFTGTVINADSMQVYRELRVLSARPSAADEKAAPHRLYGVLSGAERCSAGRWRDLALAEIAAARGAGRLPILVGGTGLYLGALVKGLAPVPDIPKEVRDAATARRAELGAEAFHRLLAERDPEGAAKIPPGNTQRVLRAFEVIEATGRTLAQWHVEQSPQAGLMGKAAALVLDPPREALYAACDASARQIVEGGGIEEVTALLDCKLDPALPVMKALGVREIAEHLAGETTRDEAVARLSRATRRYAKRQTTWFRHQLPEAERFAARYGAARIDEVRRIAETLLADGPRY
jgi:tRNA dimethylallyltransferase